MFGDPDQGLQVFARELLQLGRWRCDDPLKLPPGRAAALSDLQQLDAPINRGGYAHDIATRLESIDDRGDPSRVDAEVIDKLGHRPGRQCEQRPEEVPHHWTQAERLGGSARRLKVTLKDATQLSPRLAGQTVMLSAHCGSRQVE